jgi:hypothetical protein
MEGVKMMTEKQFRDSRRVAREFFEGLENHLNRRLRDHPRVGEHLAEVVRRAKASTDKREKRKAYYEGAFLNECVFGAVHEFVASRRRMSDDRARRALLCEGYVHNREIASGTPRRWMEHPFAKDLGATPSSIMARWRHGSLVGDSCPDLALREPFPIKTVFECKYFRQGGLQAGESALVKMIHEVFFYLGLARLPESAERAAWDYDFGCVLALDSSREGGLKEAWKEVRPTVKSGIWESANIYVMILRGSG